MNMCSGEIRYRYMPQTSLLCVSHDAQMSQIKRPYWVQVSSGLNIGMSPTLCVRTAKALASLRRLAGAFAARQ